MIELAIGLFKKLAPIIALGLLLFIVWFQGYNAAKQEWIEREAAIKAETHAIFQQAERQNALLKQSLEQSARIIEEQASENHQTITDITAHNRELLAHRLRESAGSGTNPLPNDSQATRSGDEAATAAWLVQPAVASRLIDRHAAADEVTETARACQAYVTELEQHINGQSDSTNQ